MSTQHSGVLFCGTTDLFKKAHGRILHHFLMQYPPCAQYGANWQPLQTLFPYLVPGADERGVVRGEGGRREAMLKMSRVAPSLGLPYLGCSSNRKNRKTNHKIKCRYTYMR